MNEIIEKLREGGLALDPAAGGARIDFGGQEAIVTGALSGTTLEIAASVPDCPPLDADLLIDAALRAPGNTSFEYADGSLVGRRHLLDPSLIEAYDAAHELAKATVSLAKIPVLISEVSDALEAGETDTATSDSPDAPTSTR